MGYLEDMRDAAQLMEDVTERQVSGMGRRIEYGEGNQKPRQEFTIQPSPPGFWSGFQDGYEKGRGEENGRMWKIALWMWAGALALGLALGWVLHGGWG